MNLARNGKDNKKGFYKSIGNKRKIREYVAPLLNKLRFWFMQKAELLNAFFALALTSKTGLQESWSRHQERICSNEVQSPAPGDEQATHQ